MWQKDGGLKIHRNIYGTNSYHSAFAFKPSVNEFRDSWRSETPHYHQLFASAEATIFIDQPLHDM
jgi:hypothetical protein